MMDRHIFMVLLLMFGVSSVSAQSFQQFIKAGEQAIATGDYYSALRYYSISVEMDPSRTDLWYKYAEAAQQVEAFDIAVEAYENIINSENSDEYPLAGLHLGEVYFRVGRYDQAKAMFTNFLVAYPFAATEAKQRAQLGIEQAEWAMSMANNPLDVIIRNLGEKINSTAHDFSPFLAGDTLFFTRLLHRSGKKKKSDINDAPYRIFRSIKQGISAPFEELNKVIPDDMNVAHLVFDKTRTTAYFSMGPIMNGQATNETIPRNIDFKLYRATKLSDGVWSTPELLPINSEDHIFMQPCLGFNEKLGTEVLYFASNRPGSLGGTDIWYWPLDPLLEPENLRPINTPGNEETPFFYSPTQTLYFSSDGGYLRLGGMDLFVTQWENGAWGMVENLGTPINSAYHDQYFFSSNNDQYYFSSSRIGSIYGWYDGSSDSGNFDIYNFSNAIPLRINLVDGLLNVPITDATIELFDEGELIEVLSNADDHRFLFEVGRNKQYNLIIKKPGFASAEMSIDMRGYDPSTPLEIRLQTGASYAAFPFVELYFDHLQEPGGHKFKKAIRTIPDYHQEYDRLVRNATTYLSIIDGFNIDAAQKNALKERLEVFIERDVRGGLENLEMFANTLLEYLEDGNELQFFVEPSPKPDVKPEIRKLEAEAMLEGVKGYFRKFGGGQFVPYLDDQQLKFTLLSSTGEAPRSDSRLQHITKDHPQYYTPEYLKKNRLRILFKQRFKD